MAVFGIVMLTKPTVPFDPVIMRDTVVVVVDWYGVIVELDIWEPVMFPLIARSTVAPLPVVADTVVAEGIRVGDGFGDGVGAGVGAAVGTGVGVGVGVGAGFTVTETALEAGEVTGVVALSVTVQVTECEVPAAV
jgi:hypothetical protein